MDWISVNDKLPEEFAIPEKELQIAKSFHCLKYEPTDTMSDKVIVLYVDDETGDLKWGIDSLFNGHWCLYKKRVRYWGIPRNFPAI